MAVIVFFVDGRKQEFADATSVSLDAPVFTVYRWNRKRRKPDSISTFSADQVTLAEVSDHGVVTERILGRGRREQ